MEGFAWDFADGSGRPFEEVTNGVVDLAIMYPKMKAVVAAGLSDEDRRSLEEGLARAPQNPKAVEAFDALRKKPRHAPCLLCGVSRCAIIWA